MLTRSSEYALRALTYLSLQEDRTQWVLARHIASELGIPSPFLAKILQTLASAAIQRCNRSIRGVAPAVADLRAAAAQQEDPEKAARLNAAAGRIEKGLIPEL